MPTSTPEQPAGGLALFDMDRTLVRVDTGTLYARYRRRTGQAGRSERWRVAWWVLQYGLGVMDAPRVARKAMAVFRGRSEAWMVQSCEEWFGEYVVPHISPRGRDVVKAHKTRGDWLAIVTGASRYATAPLAKALGIENVICTELEVDSNGCFTGEVVEPVCFGKGKLARVVAATQRLGASLEDAYFYTDSITDLPLLDRVGRPVVVNPDVRLTRIARRRGWRAERW